MCTTRPAACPDSYVPVCGCDGVVYNNLCDAHASGVDSNDAGGCETPAGLFACGSGFCAAGAEYCIRTVSDVGGFPDGFQCNPLPPICGNPASCDCLAQAICGEFACDTVPGGGFITTCPGG